MCVTVTIRVVNKILNTSDVGFVNVLNGRFECTSFFCGFLWVKSHLLLYLLNAIRKRSPSRDVLYIKNVLLYT